ncbi:Regulator of chromosome condensation [Platysternon megacephalum]|uniref:Regulator of chromosome condensation n=1 Tax=Platysternon megacephalum TaxID=55544 RepID=A0A4D9EZ14_9SAUR|nr:Regulator of chromosome condensation [Platysternon megacephalum]
MSLAPQPDRPHLAAPPGPTRVGRPHWLPVGAAIGGPGGGGGPLGPGRAEGRQGEPGRLRAEAPRHREQEQEQEQAGCGDSATHARDSPRCVG